MTTINIDRLVSFESDLKKLAKKHNVQIRENADLLFIYKKGALTTSPTSLRLLPFDPDLVHRRQLAKDIVNSSIIT